ncbi:putative glycoside hydrolase [Flintibacter muris]|uniref:putative glycoside hydrolase n=1 Tax=Flintibacter muris TaxID=2941327 RepID=UPI00204245CE|nr:putative glycoside hydrolase [Flintibacter muris]
MSRANRDVGGYRGRRTITDILTFIAVTLAVIVILVLAGLFFAQRYIVYTDDGPKLELPPFLQMFRREEAGPGTSASLPDPGSVSVVIEPDSSQTEPQPEQSAGCALELTVDDVVNGTAAAKLEEGDAQALILDVKEASGQLAWYSDLFTADWAEVNAPRTNNDALKEWNAGEVYTIARVCCFRDDSVPYSMNKLALRKGSYNWRDELGLRWLSPAQEEAQAYIAGLCAELAYLGFDEIVLEQFFFPVQGNVDNINQGDSYNPARFTAELEEFLTQVQAAVEPYGTKLSLRVDEDVLTSEGLALSGVTPQLLEQYACRIWTTHDGLYALSIPPHEGYEQERMVEIVAQAVQDSEIFQAVIPRQ